MKLGFDPGGKKRITRKALEKRGDRIGQRKDPREANDRGQEGPCMKKMRRRETQLRYQAAQSKRKIQNKRGGEESRKEIINR